jgi:hypothetical protein
MFSLRSSSFLWSFKPVDMKEGGNIYQLIAIKLPAKSTQAATWR